MIDPTLPAILLPPSPLGKSSMSRPVRAKKPIMTAALQLFVEHGIDATGIREVSHAAGYTEAALYRHWPGKEALVRELYQEHLTEVVARLDKAIAGASDLESKIKVAVAGIYALYDAEPLVFRFILLTSNDTRTALQDYGRTPLDVVEALANQAIQERHLDLPSANLAAALTGLFLETAVFVLYGRLPGPLASHSEMVSRLALRLIQP